VARSLIAIIFVIVGSLSVMHSGARAFETKGQLEPVLETRAKGLFEELRCVVCQNQSIGGSNADVAKDLRNIVRQQITLGKTDDQIRAFLVARYGEFILLKVTGPWANILF